MKREDGALLQRWATQELRIHEHKRGLRLVQWRQNSPQHGERGGWSSGAWNFDGILSPSAAEALRNLLNARTPVSDTPVADAEHKAHVLPCYDPKCRFCTRASDTPVGAEPVAEKCGAFDNWRSSLRNMRSYCERPKGHPTDGATCDATPSPKTETPT